MTEVIKTPCVCHAAVRARLSESSRAASNAPQRPLLHARCGVEAYVSPLLHPVVEFSMASCMLSSICVVFVVMFVGGV